MKTETITKLKKSIVSTYRKFGDEKTLTNGNRSYTGNEIADEIENETKFGIEMIDNVIKLTIDLLKRNNVN